MCGFFLHWPESCVWTKEREHPRGSNLKPTPQYPRPHPTKHVPTSLYSIPPLHNTHHYTIQHNLPSYQYTSHPTKHIPTIPQYITPYLAHPYHTTPLPYLTPSQYAPLHYTALYYIPQYKTSIPSYSYHTTIHHIVPSTSLPQHMNYIAPYPLQYTPLHYTALYHFRIDLLVQC